MNIHVNRDGQTFGPYSIDAANDYLKQGTLLPTDLACPEGESTWVPLSQIIGVNSAIQTLPVAPVIQTVLRPSPVFIAVSAFAFILALASFWVPFFSLCAFATLAFLAVDFYRTHKRIVSTMHRMDTEIAHLKMSLDCSVAQYNIIDPDRRDQLAEQIRTQQESLGVLGEIGELKDERDRLKSVINQLKSKIGSLEEEEMLQSFGFYKPIHNFADSESYRQLLEKIRERQKEMAKTDKAVATSPFRNDLSIPKSILKDLKKLILRAFNGECDATIDKVSFSNADAIKARLIKAHKAGRRRVTSHKS